MLTREQLAAYEAAKRVRNETIEECARMVEDCFDIEIARAIRALKDRQ